MEIKQIKINELKPAEYNPRKWSEKAIEDLKESIRRFGLVDPIIVNSAPERMNVVIGGHFRLKVADELGFAEVPVVYVNISDIEKEKELNLRLNRNLGEWDWQLLSHFDESMLSDVGFDNDELDSVFGMEESDEFDVDAEKEKLLKGDQMRTEAGQLWALGEHRLIIGDSTARENWERLLGEERFDFMFTDPPYRLAYSKKRTRKVKTKEGFKLKRQREYESVGKTDKEGNVKVNPRMEPAYRKIKKWAVEKGIANPTPQFAFGAKLNREYDGVAIKHSK